MKRKFANYPDWKRIIHSHYYGSSLDFPEFTGCIALFYMDSVREHLMVHCFHREFCAAGSGYSWLMQIPVGEHYAVTAQYDPAGNLIEWYIDICLRSGVTSDQIPWIDDLYLDLVVSPAYEMEILDADELQAARDSGEISPADFDLAWQEVHRLMELISQNRFPLLALSDRHRQMLLDKNIFTPLKLTRSS